MCFKSVEPLSFDNPAETDVIRRPASSTTFFVSTLAKNDNANKTKVMMLNGEEGLECNGRLAGMS